VLDTGHTGRSSGDTLTRSGIEAGAAKIVIDPLLSDNQSWYKARIGAVPGDDSNSTPGGGR
jgi:hypothetical protein